MIRFSAALVAVAIGVLIGGIATSKLLLVYIAIVVSAVALVVLAIGVALKRGELFGEGQGLVPAGAGAAPVLPARAGESQAQPRHDASAPPSAPFPGMAAGQGDVQGRDRVADAVPPWEAQSARDQWSSSPRPGSTAADPVPDWMAAGRGASDPVGLTGEAAPTRPSPVSRTPPPPPSGSSSAGSGSVSQNWFAPQARPADPAAALTPTPADPDPVDEDDDWPARYSWLEDEADESRGEPARAGAPVDRVAEQDTGDAAQASESPASVGQAADPAAEAAEAAGPEVNVAVPAATDAPVEPAPGPAKPAPAEPEPEPAEQDAVSADGEPPAADTRDRVDDLVAVLAGVPRYHRPDCVLIRFMPEDDIKRLPAEQATADGCTPCTACQPAE